MDNKLVDLIADRPHDFPVRGLMNLRKEQTIRDAFTQEQWQRINQITLDRMKSEATQRDNAKTAYIHCLNKGHDWHVRSQAAFDAGYDEPVICWRCGEWDM